MPVSDWASSELRARVGQEIVLGVRPEAMSDKAHARFVTEDNQLNMKVTLVQPLGHKMDVLFVDCIASALSRADRFPQRRSRGRKHARVLRHAARALLRSWRQRQEARAQH